jgi:hypothetical protein
VTYLFATRGISIGKFEAISPLLIHLLNAVPFSKGAPAIALEARGMGYVMIDWEGFVDALQDLNALELRLSGSGAVSFTEIVRAMRVEFESLHEQFLYAIQHPDEFGDT